jgi:hypothetical protein
MIYQCLQIHIGFETQRCSCLKYARDNTTTIKPSTSKDVGLIVGLSIGLGLPLLVLIIVVLIMCLCYNPWKNLHIKHLAGPIVNPSYVEKQATQTHRPVSQTPSTASSTEPIARPPSPVSNEATNFYWAPERPEGTTEVNQAYKEDDKE